MKEIVRCANFLPAYLSYVRGHENTCLLRAEMLIRIFMGRTAGSSSFSSQTLYFWRLITFTDNGNLPVWFGWNRLRL